MKYNALQLILKEEAEKTRLLIPFEEIIKENPEEAFLEEALIAIMAPGFHKYFTKEWKWGIKELTIDMIEELRTIDDPKFRFLDEERRVTNIITIVAKLILNKDFMVSLLFNLVHNLNNSTIAINNKVLPTEVKQFIIKVRSLMIKYEMEYDFNKANIGVIHMLKRGNHYELLNGHHRLIAYLLHTGSMGLKFPRIKVLVGERVGED